MLLLRCEQTDQIDEPRQHSDRVGAAAESKQIYPVAILIVSHQELVGIQNIGIEAVTGGQAKNTFCLVLESGPGTTIANCPDAGIIEGDLRIVFLP